MSKKQSVKQDHTSGLAPPFASAAPKNPATLRQQPSSSSFSDPPQLIDSIAYWNHIRTIVQYVQERTDHACSLAKSGFCNLCQSYVSLRTGFPTIIDKSNYTFDYEKDLKTSQLYAALVASMPDIPGPLIPIEDAKLTLTSTTLVVVEPQSLSKETTPTTPLSLPSISITPERPLIKDATPGPFASQISSPSASESSSSRALTITEIQPQTLADFLLPIRQHLSSNTVSDDSVNSRINALCEVIDSTIGPQMMSSLPFPPMKETPKTVLPSTEPPSTCKLNKFPLNLQAFGQIVLATTRLLLKILDAQPSREDCLSYADFELAMKTIASKSPTVASDSASNSVINLICFSATLHPINDYKRTDLCLPHFCAPGPCLLPFLSNYYRHAPVHSSGVVPPTQVLISYLAHCTDYFKFHEVSEPLSFEALIKCLTALTPRQFFPLSTEEKEKVHEFTPSPSLTRSFARAFRVPPNVATTPTKSTGTSSSSMSHT